MRLDTRENPLTATMAGAALHEGVLNATSTLGQGSSFRLRLPVARPTAR